MPKLTNQVLEFRQHIGLPVGFQPRLLEPEQVSFYARFAMEELSEFLLAHEHGELVDAADALGDLIYAMVGAMHHMGLPIDEVFEVIHNANMAKVAGKTKRNGTGVDASKPDGWVAPEAELKILLDHHMWVAPEDELKILPENDIED